MGGTDSRHDYIASYHGEKMCSAKYLKRLCMKLMSKYDVMVPRGDTIPPVFAVSRDGEPFGEISYNASQKIWMHYSPYYPFGETTLSQTRGLEQTVPPITELPSTGLRNEEVEKVIGSLPLCPYCRSRPMLEVKGDKIRITGRCEYASGFHPKGNDGLRECVREYTEGTECPTGSPNPREPMTFGDACEMMRADHHIKFRRLTWKSNEFIQWVPRLEIKLGEGDFAHEYKTGGFMLKAGSDGLMRPWRPRRSEGMDLAWVIAEDKPKASRDDASS